MTSLTTSVEPLEGNKVRLSVTVPAAEFERAVDAAFRKLAREVKIPGFRPGKAPRRLLEARFGTGYAREQALRDAVPGYYAQAVAAEAIDAIAAPEIDITAGEEGGDVAFDAVVEVRPVVHLEGYEGLRVEIPSPVVRDEAVEAQLDALRERFAELEDSAGPLVDGNFALIDVKCYVHDEVIDALSATDFLYEVGSGMLVEELDTELRGKRPGDILKFNATLPERFGERAGQEVSFQVIVKETKRKVLPQPTDEWASEVSEFDTIEALRDDIRARLGLVAKIQAQMLVRDKVLDEVAKLVDVEVPDSLVSAEIERRLRDLAHQLEHQGLAIDSEGVWLARYLAATGQEQGSFVAALREASVAAVRADLALRAVVAQEGITADDDEIADEIERLAARLEERPERVRRDLERRGAIGALRSDLARGKALRFLIDHAEVVDEEGHPVDLSLPEGGPAGDADESAASESSDTNEEPEE